MPAWIKWNIVGAKTKLAKLAKALREAGGDAVEKRAHEEIQWQIHQIAERITDEHLYSGAAHESLMVGGDSQIAFLTFRRYLSMHTWWIFRKGVPATVLRNALKVYSEALLSTIQSRPPDFEAWDIARDVLGGGLKKSAEQLASDAEAMADIRRMASEHVHGSKWTEEQKERLYGYGIIHRGRSSLLHPNRKTNATYRDPGRTAESHGERMSRQETALQRGTASDERGNWKRGAPKPPKLWWKR